MSHYDFKKCIERSALFTTNKWTLEYIKGNILEVEIAARLHADITLLFTDLKKMLKDKCIIGKIKVNRPAAKVGVIKKRINLRLQELQLA